MTYRDRIVADHWFTSAQALAELDKLKFAMTSLVEVIGKSGSYEYEMAQNALRGIRQRIDFLHDSLVRILPHDQQWQD